MEQVVPTVVGKEAFDILKLVEYTSKQSYNIATLEAQIKSLKDNKEHLESEDLDELSVAFAKAQGEYDLALFNRINPFFKNDYADLNAIIAATKVALSTNGLAFTQLLREDDNGKIWLYSRLMHSSGQWISSKICVPAFENSNEFGAAVIYKKRYAASALLKIVGCEPDDDDGARESEKDFRSEPSIHKENVNNSKANIQLISKDHLAELHRELNGLPEYAEKILARYNVKSLSSLEDKNYVDIITRVREIKEDLKYARK